MSRPNPDDYFGPSATTATPSTPAPRARPNPDDYFDPPPAPKVPEPGLGERAGRLLEEARPAVQRFVDAGTDPNQRPAPKPARPYVAGGVSAEGDPRLYGVEPSGVRGGRGTVVPPMGQDFGQVDAYGTPIPPEEAQRQRLAPDDMQPRALTLEQVGRDFQGGVEQVKALGTGAAAFGAGASWRQFDRALADMDAIDQTGAPPRRPGVMGDTGLAPWVESYAMADPQTRAQIRQRVTQGLQRDQQFIADARDAVAGFNAEQRRLSGKLPDFTDIRSVQDFAAWAVRNGVATTPTMAASMLGALAGPGGLAVTSSAMALGDMTGARLETADQVTNPRRFGSADRQADALAARDEQTARRIAGETGNTGVLAVPYAALDFAGGPAAAIARREVAGMASGGARQVAKNLGKQTGGEMGNEGGQEVVNVVADMAAGERPVEWTGEDTKRVINAAAVGGLMGAAGGGANIGSDAVMGKLRDARVQQQLTQRAVNGDIEAALVLALAQKQDMTPADLVREAQGQFDNAAARFGVPSKVVQAAKARTDGMPADEVPGFLTRAMRELAKRGLVRKPPPGMVEEQPTPAATPAPLQSDTGAVPADEVLGAAADERMEGNGPANPPAQPTIATPLDERAHAAATSPTNDRPDPTEAQQKAGNYAKGAVRLAGMDVSIENPEGSVRRGVDPDGTPWETRMTAHYGYIRGTKAGDGDHSDVYIKPGTPQDYAGPVFVVDQIDPRTGKFDEHKSIIGAATEEEARALYLSNYTPDWRGLGAVTQLPMQAFKSWVRDGVKRKPLGNITAARPQENRDATTDVASPANAGRGADAPGGAPSAGIQQAIGAAGRVASDGAGTADGGAPARGLGDGARGPGPQAGEGRPPAGQAAPADDRAAQIAQAQADLKQALGEIGQVLRPGAQPAAPSETGPGLPAEASPSGQPAPAPSRAKKATKDASEKQGPDGFLRWLRGVGGVHMRHKLEVTGEAHPILGTTIDSVSRLAILGKSVQKPGWVTLIGTTGEAMRVRVVAEAPASILKRPPAVLAATLRRLARKAGASSMFLVGSDGDIASAPVRAAIEQGLLLDALPETGLSLRSRGVNPQRVLRSFDNPPGRVVAEPDAMYQQADGVTRREALVAAASALASPPAAAGDIPTGKAKPIPAEVLLQPLPADVAKLLRGNGSGTTNIQGAQVLRQALQMLATSGAPELRGLAAQTLRLMPEGRVMLTVDDTRLRNAHGVVEAKPLPHMTLFTAEGRRGLTYETFLHESMHVVVLARYRALAGAVLRSNDKILGMPAPKAAEALAQFRALWDELERLALSKPPTEAERLSVSESVGKLDEFFVRALTDPILQGYLARHRYEGKTLLERFKDWVKRTLFVVTGGVHPSWLDAALTATHDLVDAMAGDPADFKRLEASTRLRESQRQVFENAAAPGELRPSSGILDTILRKSGGTLLARLTSPTYDRLLGVLDRGAHAVGGDVYLYAKAGLVADYGLGADYLDAKHDMETGIRKGTREAATLIERLQTLTRAEARIAYLWMQEKPDTALEAELMAQLPEESRQTLTDLKRRVDELGRQAVELGLLSSETYERNAMAYLHRSYQKYEAQNDAERTARARAIRIHGDQFKGRGLRHDVPPTKLGGNDWWQRRQEAGQSDTSLKGMKFRRLELRRLPDETTPDMVGDRGPGRLGRLESVIYWPEGEAVPRQYADWRDDGLWEARFFDKTGKVGMWRDFTLAERTQMGEIQEVRYSAAKTMLQATRDVEVARLLDWVARNKSEVAEDQIPEGHKVVDATESLTRAYLETEWVKVPDRNVPGTKVPRYGNLAGRYVPGPVWNDIRQIQALTEHGDIARAFNSLMSAWKISKTALSPATHMNNVMSNFILADAHDIQARHIGRAVHAWVRHRKRGSMEADPAAKKLIEDYQDHGGDGGKFNEGELREDVAKQLLEQLERDLNEQPEATARLSALQVVDLLRHRQFRQAFAAIGQTKTAGAMGAPARTLIKLYGREDEVFRLAAFLKAREDGLSDHDAGLFARRSFLDYSINAPWINALRRTAFPFIAFTYRAVPMLARIAVDKPWKLAKCALVAGVLNAAAYAMTGGDEDDERALLPDEKAGKLWGIFPKLLRMPWNDEHGSPVFLDIRRWVPAGDVFDTNANHAAAPVPAPLVPGGPLVILAELLGNRSWFTGQNITKETDTLAEKYAKVADYLWKSAAPNFPGLPGTYSTEALVNAGSGKTDVFGREQSLGQAALSSVGVKVASYPPDVLLRNASLELRAQVAEIRRGLASDARMLARNGMTREEFDQRAASANEKLRKLFEDMQRKQGQRAPAVP